MHDAAADDQGRLDRLRAHLEAAQRIADLGSWEVELPSGATHWSPDLDDIFGWPPSHGGHERLLGVVHPDDRDRVAQAHDRAVRTGAPYALDHRIVRADGIRHVHQEVVVEHGDDGRPTRLIGTVQDVTERTRLARRQADTESRRRELLHRLVQASVAARSQLAGDLHDGPVQVLTATAMRLEVLGLGAEDRPPWLDDVLPVVREVCAQLREVLYELHPHVDDGGIGDAIAHLASTVLPGTPVHVGVEGAEPGRDAARAVHGVVQEALWDVRERDCVDELTVVVQADDVTVVVLDGGAGTQHLLSPIGLLGVRERCEALGGTADLDAGGRVLRCTLRIAGGAA